MNEKELDLRLRDALLEAVSAEYSLLPDEEEPPLPIGLLRRMRPLLADPCGRRRRTRRRAGRAVVPALLALSVSFGTLVAVNPQARAWVQRMVIQFLDRHAAIHFVGDSPAGELGNWAPTWLPEGYELYDIFNHSETLYYLDYTNTEGRLISISFSNSPGYTPSVDNEHHVEETVFINGSPAYLLRAIVPCHESHLFWYNENFGTAFSISAELPVGDLIKIAESIEKN